MGLADRWKLLYVVSGDGEEEEEDGSTTDYYYIAAKAWDKNRCKSDPILTIKYSLWNLNISLIKVHWKMENISFFSVIITIIF